MARAVVRGNFTVIGRTLVFVIHSHGYRRPGGAAFKNAGLNLYGIVFFARGAESRLSRLSAV